MDFWNHEWLGFAGTPIAAGRMICDTGFFYLAVAVAHLLSFLYIFWPFSNTKPLKKGYYFSIFLWLICGLWLVYLPSDYSVFPLLFASGLSLRVLYQFHRLHHLVSEGTIIPPGTDDKRILYALTLLKKIDYTLADMLKVTLMNEQILWLLVLYKSAVALRAYLAF